LEDSKNLKNNFDQKVTFWMFMCQNGGFFDVFGAVLPINVILQYFEAAKKFPNIAINFENFIKNFWHER